MMRGIEDQTFNAEVPTVTTSAFLSSSLTVMSMMCSGYFKWRAFDLYASTTEGLNTSIKLYFLGVALLYDLIPATVVLSLQFVFVLQTSKFGKVSFRYFAESFKSVNETLTCDHSKENY